ncbi:hypothetical protein [Bacillus paramycoides]|uniref:hypothetical protein n=1 Tax=Bacillus paramycoides TaxID=2026194 RepID=UPI002E24E1A7|nr:hypothetical protein [Bacillus paramycoides]
MSEVPTCEKTTISVLIIEDEEIQIEAIQDAIDDFNDENPDFQILCEFSKSFSESLKLLLTNDFDATIIDLNLDQTATEPSDLDGNKLVDIIVNKIRIPITIRTGYPTQFSSEKIDESNSFLKIYKKTDSIDEILHGIVQWYGIGLASTLGTKGILESCLNKLFWEQISKNLNEWEKNKEDSKEQEKSLLRYTLNVLQSYLEVDLDSGKYENFHPAEVYIKPPIKQDLFFGDILKKSGNEHFLILTPSCEMAQGKYKKILLSRILNHEDLEGFKQARTGYIENQSKGKRSALEKWFRNGHDSSLGYHFLPSYSDFPGGFIDFQDVVSLSQETVIAEYEKIATVTNQFAKDISSRFTLYYARQGQPNLNSDLIIKMLCGELQTT